MINLRSLDKRDVSQENSDAQHFSRFSTPIWRAAEGVSLGNIGEDLAHGHAEPAEQVENGNEQFSARGRPVDQRPSGTRPHSGSASTHPPGSSSSEGEAVILV